MSFCLNPDCQMPQNPQGMEFCGNCGTRLLLKERYRAIDLIGQGGFGRTFLAIDEDKPSKPRCVIKQFCPSNQGTRHLKKAVELFEQEAMRLEELGSHPQIPTLLAHLSQGSHQYLVQEFIDGQNLLEALADQGALSEAQIREVLTSLLPVLEFIHARAVIHRDIKPANIIAAPGSRIVRKPVSPDQLDWTGLLQALARETAQGFRDFTSAASCFSQLLSQSLVQPPRTLAIADYDRCQQMGLQFAQYPALPFSQRQYLVADASRLLYELRRKYELPGAAGATAQLVLVDFGAAKLVSNTALMRTGTTIGSPDYLAPEQARGKAVFASDLYSLGVTCLHLLTDTAPADLYDSHEDAWVWRRYLKQPVSEQLGQVLDRLIESGLRRRYQSATEVLQVLNPQPVLLNARSLNTRSLMVVGSPAIELAAAAPPLPSPAPLPSPPISLAPKPRTSSRRKATASWHSLHQLVSPGKVYAIALHPQEPILISSSGTTIKLWDLQTGEFIRTLSGHLDIVTALAVSPEGTFLVSGSADKTLKLWNLQTGKRLASLTLHTDTVLAIALSPDGKTLASSSLYDPIVLLDMVTGQERDRLYGHAYRVNALAFSSDGSLLVSGSSDTTIRCWDVATSQELRTLQGHTQAVSAIAFSPDGKTFASGSWDGSIKLWSSGTRRQKRTLTVASGRVTAIAFSPDGKTLMAGSETLQFWNARTGKELSPLAKQLDNVGAIAIGSAANAPELGQVLVTASGDSLLQVWGWMN